MEPLDFVELPVYAPGPKRVQQAEVQGFELKDANRALALLKQGKINGAAVLRIPH